MNIRFDKTIPTDAIGVVFEKGHTTTCKEAGKTSLSVGYGDTLPLNKRKATLLLRKVIVAAKGHRFKQLCIEWSSIRALFTTDVSDNECGSIAAEAWLMANYEHTTYKQKPKDGFPDVRSISILRAPKEAAKGIARGAVIGEMVNSCRELANTPGGDMTPSILASAAKKAVQGTSATISVLSAAQMAKLGMGAVLGIGKGSQDEPKFIIAQYQGAAKADKPLVFIGKGVTFDTGGLNIKTGDHMYEMHMDMSGGAAVLYATVLAAKLNVKANVIALIPAVENAPGPGAVRPGDMLKSLSGKNIEILNTDAEGRVILADAITYSKRFNPKMVIDVATLTGAAVVALGTQRSAFMTNTMEMVPEIMDIGHASGDYVWPFPLGEEYDPMVKSTFGDVPNISTMGSSRDGGVIAGGKFLEVFAKELSCPWIHIDMAPRTTSAPGDNLAKGAAGEPVRLLLAIAEKYGGK